jgi:hypothetical protein
MAKRHAQTSYFDFPVEVVLQVLVDEQFQVDREKVHGNPDARVEDVSRSDSRYVYKVHTTEYAKGIKGIDRSKTEMSVTTYEWDLVGKKCTWTYVGAQANRVKVWGGMQVNGTGESCQLPSDFNVDVRIPLVGGKVEKVVIDEAKKGWARWENLIVDYCKKLS